MRVYSSTPLQELQDLAGLALAHCRAGHVPESINGETLIHQRHSVTVWRLLHSFSLYPMCVCVCVCVCACVCARAP